MSFFVLIIVSMFLADLLWWAWAHWRVRNVRRSRAWRVAIGVFMGVQTLCLTWMIGGRLLELRPDNAIPQLLPASVYLWHFIGLPFAVVSASASSIVGGIRAIRRRWKRQITEPVAGPDPSRRQFLRLAMVSAPPVATAVVTGLSAAQIDDFRIRRFTLPMTQLPRDLDGLTIAHVTDIHVGRFTTERTLRKIVDTTNALKPDLTLLTGDLINHALSDLPGALDAVKRLDARHGVVMCEGNHDLIESRDGFETGVRRAGVKLLLDESTFIPLNGRTIQLIGQRWVGRHDLAINESAKSLLATRQPGAFPILLAHHPHAFDSATDAGIPLTLAGHTHGGQLMLPGGIGFGPLMFRYWSGLYQRAGANLLVSNGVGNWFPLRVNAPAEILHITLRTA